MESDAKQLTVNDPVQSATLKRLAELQEARQVLADQLLDLEQERIRMLALARPIDQERNKIFEGLLAERGLPPNFPVRIDAPTGKIELLAPVPEKKPES